MRALVCLAFALIPLAQSAGPTEVSIRSAPYIPPPPKISAQSNLVESGVTVFDAQGRAAGGFTAADFALTDNGRPKPITIFSELRGSVPAASAAAGKTPSAAGVSADSPQPRNVALFFDDLHLTSAGLPLYRKAAEKLIRAGLPPGERMGIFTDSGEVTVDFTTDAAPLLDALPRIKPHKDPAERGMTVCPTLTAYSAYVIKEHIDEGEKERAVLEVMACDCRSGDACRLAAEGTVMDTANTVWENSRHYSTTVLDVLKLLVAHLGKQDGSRVLVMVSGGFIDDGRMGTEKSAIFEAASSAHVTINSLAVESQMGYRQLIVTNTMVDAAAATGGRVIKNTNDLDGALDTLATAPEVSYLIGFQPGEPDGKFHTLRIALPHRTGFRIESRQGYFAGLPSQDSLTVQQRIDGAVLSNTVVRDVPATVRVLPTVRNNGYTLKVVVDVDAKRIKFAAQAGLHLQQLTFVTAIEDAEGKFVTGKQATTDLRVKPTTLASMQTTGIHAVSSFALPRGSYTVREVVREMVQNHIAALNAPVELR